MAVTYVLQHLFPELEIGESVGEIWKPRSYDAPQG